MGKKKGGKKSKPLKTLAPPPEEPDELTRAPHSFVIHRGTVGKHIMQLLKDFRKVMEPFTASSLKVNKKNSVKDFASISGLLHVSHMTVFTITETSPYMRIARLPQGPTLTFKIHDYSLARDVVSSLRKQYTHSKCFLNSPLIIMNGFSGQGPQLKLMSTMFQSMFPTLNVVKLNLNNMKRCVLLNYNEETKCIDFRHYVIRVTPTGLNRGVKKLVLGKIPNLAKYKDVSDFVYKDELLSDMSEPEDEGSHVVIPQKLASKGNQINNTSAIRLTEIGPRLTLQLVKVEGGLMDGEVMFHEYVHKTEEEIYNMKKQRRIKRRLKEVRRREQERNVERKEEEKALHKERCLEGMRKKAEENKIKTEEDLEVAEPEARDSPSIPSEEDTVENPTIDDNKADDEDDDAEWYRKEVGEEPDPDMFTPVNRGMKRRGPPLDRRDSFKKPRFGRGRSGPGGDRNQDGFRRNNDRRGGGGFRSGRDRNQDGFRRNNDGRGRGGFRGTRQRLGTGRGRFQRGGRGGSGRGFGSRSSFSRDDFNRDSSHRGSSRGGFRGRGRGNRGSGRGNFSRN